MNAASTLTGMTGGNGFNNNAPFAIAQNGADFGDMPNDNGNQYNIMYNNGYYSRLKKVVDTTLAGGDSAQNNFFNTATATGVNATSIMTPQQLSNEFKP